MGVDFLRIRHVCPMTQRFAAGMPEGRPWTKKRMILWKKLRTAESFRKRRQSVRLNVPGNNQPDRRSVLFLREKVPAGIYYFLPFRISVRIYK